ncbi:MAG: response regulator [Deltaproteobacteria bacterium]|nr:response regulator [Deltaproteobacteria bacterium]
MARPLKVLILDDSEDDVMLLLREVRRSGFEPTYRVVCSPDDTRAALLAEPWELVISDWSMPGSFTGLVAFEIMRELGLDLPFIIVSGAIDEDIAIGALKAGVHDFMTKGKFARLAPSIERELREVELRRRQREADDQLASQRRELERSERLLREVLNSVPDAVIVIDREGRILTRNAAADALLAVPADPATMTKWRSEMELLVDNEELPLDARPLNVALNGDSVDGQQLLLRHRGKDDQGVWLSASARPLRDDAGVFGAVGIFRDMTAERAAQHRLMVSDRMASIGMLAAGVAHELNNPLAAVLANLELAMELFGGGTLSSHDLTEVIEMVGDAQTAADRVRQIVKDLKIFARHEDSPLGAVSLTSALESTLRMAWNEIRHRARLVKSYADTPLVRGTESRLGQVFLNLIVNAAQAIPEGSADRNTITVATRTEGNTVVVEISDTGTGMSLETQRQLFIPFFTTKPQGQGTGLGLAISHQIVTGFGGTITVDSTPGKGTTFRVALPIAAAEHVPRGRTPTRPMTPKRARILVVDDEPMITTVLSRVLSAEHEVRATASAIEALELVRANNYDVILCDVMMPQMTGMEFHERLLAENPDQAARIVFMTGDAFTAAARAFLDEVPNDRLEKPFDTATLHALIRNRIK